MQHSPEWQARFFQLAQHIKTWSKQSKKVGAVLVDSQRKVVGTGYNGPPCTCDDSKVDGINSDYLVAHAELNSLANSIGDNLVMYVTEQPCLSCATAIVGGKRVIEIVMPIHNSTGRWAESQLEATKYLVHSKIKVSFI